MAKIFGIIQVKGGAGRSTVATNLAGELAKRGRTVLIDGDMPQGTSASWYTIRRDRGRADDLIADTASGHRELIEKTERHAKAGVKFIVLDGPPRIAEMTRAILMMADVCLLPVGASVAEIWATTDVLAIIEEAKKAGKRTKAFIVWTRHRPHTALARDLTDQVEKDLGLPTLPETLGMRVAYPEALGTGRTAAEVGDAMARDEIRAFVDHVIRL